MEERGQSGHLQRFKCSRRPTLGREQGNVGPNTTCSLRERREKRQHDFALEIQRQKFMGCFGKNQQSWGLEEAGSVCRGWNRSVNMSV